MSSTCTWPVAEENANLMGSAGYTFEIKIHNKQIDKWLFIVQTSHVHCDELQQKQRQQQQHFLHFSSWIQLSASKQSYFIVIVEEL